jgi:signal transduction histidine kinase/CheY-like chemotaxis protein
LARHRAIVVVTFAMCSFSAVIGLVDLLIIGNQSDAAVELGAVTAGPVILALLAKTRKPDLPGHLILCIIAAVVTYMMAKGTGLFSNATYHMATLPLIAAGLVGRSGSWIWGSYALLLLVTFAVGHHLGVYPQVDYGGSSAERTVNVFVLIATAMIGNEVLLWVQGTAFSDLRRAYERLQVENQERRRAEDEARAAEQTSARFLATMSHEMRTPLHGIIGSVALINSAEIPEEQRQLVGVVRASSDHLLSLINDVLDYSRLEAGQVVLEATRVDLGEAFETAVFAIKPLVDAKGLQVTCEIHPDLPPVITGDPVRLRQILINLLGNAAKFTPKGKVGVRARRIEDGRLEIAVHDTGIGMDADTLARLFQPFMQADATTTRRFGGTGLGLAIVRGLVAAMRGEVTVESELGVGTVFRVIVPYAPWAFEADDEASLAQEDVRRLTVLVVDDNLVNRTIARKLLERDGHTVVEAMDGEQALSLLSGTDVVLMDLHMPNMDGMEATRRIRLDPAVAHLPVIGLSASTQAEDRAAGLGAGMNEYLAKPLRPDDLRRAIWAAVSR